MNPARHRRRSPLAAAGPQLRLLPDCDGACRLCGRRAAATPPSLPPAAGQILRVCADCWAARRRRAPRTLWLQRFDLPDGLWLRLALPMALVFVLPRRGQAPLVVCPTAAGAAEGTADAEAWRELVRRNPVLATLQPDEALLLSRLKGSAAQAVLPLRACQHLIERARGCWEGITGGAALRLVVRGFCARLRACGDGGFGPAAGG